MVFKGFGASHFREILDKKQLQKSVFMNRRFSLHLGDGEVRQVSQLQTEDWPDLSAPEGPRLLVEMVHQAQMLQGLRGTQGPGRGVFSYKEGSV